MLKSQLKVFTAQLFTKPLRAKFHSKYTPIFIPMQDKTLHEIITENPSVSNVFEKYNLDFCCHGKQTLVEACNSHYIPIETVVADIERLISLNGIKHSDSETVSHLPIPQLVDHIISTHHEFLRNHVPSTKQYLDKVVRVHRDRHPELKQLHSITTKELDDIMSHIQKEEKFLFQILKKDPITWTSEEKNQLKEEIQQLEQEHQEQGTALAAMRKTVGVTTSYIQSVPKDGCKSYQILFQKLDQFEQDTHLHVHKENYILFPKVIQMLTNKPQ